MGTPALWIVAGPNGAGKTSFVQSSLFARLLSSDTQLHLTPVAEGVEGELTAFDESRCFPELRRVLSQVKVAS